MCNISLINYYVSNTKLVDLSDISTAMKHPKGRYNTPIAIQSPIDIKSLVMSTRRAVKARYSQNSVGYTSSDSKSSDFYHSIVYTILFYFLKAKLVYTTKAKTMLDRMTKASQTRVTVRYTTYSYVLIDNIFGI